MRTKKTLAACVGNMISAIGGTVDGSASVNLVQVYDPVANTWSSETPIQQTRDGTTGMSELCVILPPINFRINIL